MWRGIEERRLRRRGRGSARRPIGGNGESDAIRQVTKAAARQCAASNGRGDCASASACCPNLARWMNTELPGMRVMPVVLAGTAQTTRRHWRRSPGTPRTIPRIILRMIRGQRTGVGLFEKASNLTWRPRRKRLQASTFTARVVASTIPAMSLLGVAALCALKGPAAWRVRPGRSSTCGRDRRGP